VNLSFIPNAICIVRILLVVPLVAALFAGEYKFALLLMVVAGLSDGIDGFLARAFGWRSHLGSLLDPAADKLLMVSTFLSLTALGLVPLALTVIVVLRDLVIVFGAFVYQQLRGNLHGEPVLISKLNTVCQLGFIILTITQAEWGRPGTYWLTLLGAMVVFTSISSGLTYVLVWSKRARQSAGAV
jgi:cardiolipin synthase (CMP-forming)